MRVTSPRHRGFVYCAAIAMSFWLHGACFATFHFMEISEVAVGIGGDCRVQYIEMQMTSAGQNLVGNHDLYFFDASGTLTGVFTLPDNVENGDDGSFILVATQAFADATGATPDFVMPAGLLMAHGGRVAFDQRDPNAAVDSVAYGIYSGDNGNKGAPAPRLAADDDRSLTRTGSTGDNAADFALAAPTPTTNDGTAIDVSALALECFVEDDFDNLDNWDVPLPNEGLDMELCVGQPFVADIGSAVAEDGAMLLQPGLADELDLGVPIVFATLKGDVAETFSDEPGYRVRFDFFPQLGIVFGLVHLHQYLGVDELTGLFDPGQAGGMGLNYSIDSVTEVSDHVHPDVRTICLQEGFDPSGPGTVDFTEEIMPGLLFVTEREYTIILDTFGDEINGPLTVSVKLFAADVDEPADYLASWTLLDGLGIPELDPDQNHEILLTTLGAPGSAMEIRNFTVCEIPRSQLAVTGLTCFRNFDDTITVTWQNPVTDDPADEAHPIAIVVNGVEVERIDGDSIEYIIEDPPEADAVIEVYNFSCTAARCEVCFNNPPAPAIEGPTTVELPAGETVQVTLDSTTSTDVEDDSSALIRLWSVASKPAGSTATFDQQGAEIVQLRVDQVGEYQARLSVSDNGCVDGGLDPKSRNVIHTFNVVPESTAVELLRGDINGDNAVNISDAQYTLNFLFLGGPGTDCADAGDANDDGAVNISDAQFTLNFLFLGGPPPPEPGHLACGEDPSDDTLPDCERDGC